MADACKGLKNVYVQMFTDRKFYREIKVPQGKVLDRVEVIKEVLDSDVLISLPQAKSHSATGVSMGIKGLMGLIWDRWSFHAKYNIDQALADLATVIKPQLTILDATRALVTGGPGGPGEVVKPNLVIAGTDPVAVDSYGVTVAPWYGQQFKGRQVEHLLAAQPAGPGKDRPRAAEDPEGERMRTSRSRPSPWPFSRSCSRLPITGFRIGSPPTSTCGWTPCWV